MPTLNWNDDVFFSIQIHPVYQFHVCSNIFLMDAAPVVFRVKKSASFTNLLKTDETSISFFIILLCLCLFFFLLETTQLPQRKHSMYGLFTYIYHTKFQPNVGQCTTHWVSGQVFSAPITPSHTHKHTQPLTQRLQHRMRSTGDSLKEVPKETNNLTESDYSFCLRKSCMFYLSVLS